MYSLGSPNLEQIFSLAKSATPAQKRKLDFGNENGSAKKAKKDEEESSDDDR